jgi:hypothetical protein
MSAVGRWLDFDIPWHDTSVRHCDVCGRLIPASAWLFTGIEGDVMACGPECEELYFDYWVEAHGTLGPGSGGESSS